MKERAAQKPGFKRNEEEAINALYKGLNNKRENPQWGVYIVQSLASIGLNLNWLTITE